MNVANMIDLLKRTLNDLRSFKIKDKVQRNDSLVTLTELAFEAF